MCAMVGVMPFTWTEPVTDLSAPITIVLVPLAVEVLAGTSWAPLRVAGGIGAAAIGGFSAEVAGAGMAASVLVAEQPELSNSAATAASHKTRMCFFEVSIRRSPVV
jgi:hypothetical protein